MDGIFTACIYELNKPKRDARPCFSSAVKMTTYLFVFLSVHSAAKLLVWEQKENILLFIHVCSEFHGSRLKICFLLILLINIHRTQIDSIVKLLYTSGLKWLSSK